MLRIVHERHEKNIRCRFLADGVIPCMHSFSPFSTPPRTGPRRYTHSVILAGMPEPKRREVRLRVTQVFTGCVVIPIVPDLALGNKQADRQTSQVFKTWEV